MDQYAFYIWASYAVAALVLIALAAASILGARLADRTVEALRAVTGRAPRQRRAGGREEYGREEEGGRYGG